MPREGQTRTPMSVFIYFTTEIIEIGAEVAEFYKGRGKILIKFSSGGAKS